MRKIAYVPLVLFSLIIGSVWILLTTAFGLAHRVRWNSEHLRFGNQWRPCFAKRWKFSTTIGAVTLHPSHLRNPRLWEHESVHIRQFDDQSIAAWFMVPAVYFLPIWTVPVSLVLCIYIGSSLGAWLRGHHIYRDAEHERSAYAQTDRQIDGKSWLEKHLSKPRKL